MDKIKSIVLNKKYQITFIILIAFVLRLFLSISSFTYESYSSWKDAALYLKIGEAMAGGDLYPDASGLGYMHTAPLYPMIIALCIKIFGTAIFPMFVLNSLIGALFVWLVYKIGVSLFSHKVGLFIAIWGALNYNMMRNGFSTLKEPFIFLFITGLALTLINIWKDKRSWFNVVWHSLMTIALIHIDERYIYYVPFFAIILVVVSSKKEKIKHLVLYSLLSVALMIPWTVANYKQYDQIVILTPRVNSSLQKVLGEDMLPTPKLIVKARAERGLGELDEFATTSLEHRTLITEDGREIVWSNSIGWYVRGFFEHMRPTYFMGTNVYIVDGWGFRKWSLFHNVNGILFYGIFLPFYLIGLVLSAIKKEYIWVMMLLLPIIHGVMHAVVPLPLERYRLTFDFVVVLGAIYTLNGQMYLGKNYKVLQ